MKTSIMVFCSKGNKICKFENFPIVFESVEPSNKESEKSGDLGNNSNILKVWAKI